MKFSLISLFAVVAFLAVACAAMVSPGDVFIRTHVSLWMLVFTYFIAMAMVSADLKWAAFSRAVVGITAGYLLLPYFVGDLRGEMPHDWGTKWIETLRDKEAFITPEEAEFQDIFSRGGRKEYQVGVTQDYAYPERAITTSTTLNLDASLCLGLLGGSLVLWRYRLLERREKMSA